jgi:hypothetical protein
VLLFSDAGLNGPHKVGTVNRALTGMRRASGVVARIDAQLFHSRQESGAIHSHPRGSPLGAAHSPLGFGESAHDRIPLPLRILFVDASVGMES